eukprot:TRINITY_DN12394_c0_g4_i1.p1 TRINITY_DN12394_c0_g4~~TRINITY_DN12394_c0_g4_i1.p1  ORF type:complete len:325 (+),score=30.73 TRINITY_DN12394_c0_g4_i1:101-1075(+)
MESLTKGSLIPTKNFLPKLPLKSAPSTYPNLHFPIQRNPKPRIRVRVRVRASSNSKSSIENKTLIQRIKTGAGTLILTAAAAILVSRFSQLPAKAESPTIKEEQEQEEEVVDKGSAMSKFIESNPNAIASLKSLLQEKLEIGEDSEALQILKYLVSAQPSNLDWKFLTARLLNEMGESMEARKVFEEILAVNPLSFEALFENALIMDRCGEGEAVLERLEKALEVAKSQERSKEARDVRFIMAQILYLQKNIEESLESYRELAKEDPKDFRPYFCQGVIYSFLDRNKEAREQFAKYRELCPKKFDVEGFLQTPLSRIKLFGTEN